MLQITYQSIKTKQNIFFKDNHSILHYPSRQLFVFYVKSILHFEKFPDIKANITLFTGELG